MTFRTEIPIRFATRAETGSDFYHQASILQSKWWVFGCFQCADSYCSKTTGCAAGKEMQTCVRREHAQMCTIFGTGGADLFGYTHRNKWSIDICRCYGIFSLKNLQSASRTFRKPLGETHLYLLAPGFFTFSCWSRSQGQDKLVG